MDRLWTPWRYTYITDAIPQRFKGVPPDLEPWLTPHDAHSAPLAFYDRHCVFCNMIAAVDHSIARGLPAHEAEKAALIVHRGAHCFICLNRFPYSTGHVLIVPHQHADSLAALPPATALEIISLAQQTESALRAVYHPDGLNFGLNLGQAAGAGVADHLHLHALPRWSGDVNFMTSTAETRILPETLEITWARLGPALSTQATPPQAYPSKNP